MQKLLQQKTKIKKRLNQFHERKSLHRVSMKMLIQNRLSICVGYTRKPRNDRQDGD